MLDFFRNLKDIPFKFFKELFTRVQLLEFLLNLYYYFTPAFEFLAVFERPEDENGDPTLRKKPWRIALSMCFFVGRFLHGIWTILTSATTTRLINFAWLGTMLAATITNSSSLRIFLGVSAGEVWIPAVLLGLAVITTAFSYYREVRAEWRMEKMDRRRKILEALREIVEDGIRIEFSEEERVAYKVIEEPSKIKVLWKVLKSKMGESFATLLTAFATINPIGFIMAIVATPFEYIGNFAVKQRDEQRIFEIKTEIRTSCETLQIPNIQKMDPQKIEEKILGAVEKNTALSHKIQKIIDEGPKSRLHEVVIRRLNPFHEYKKYNPPRKRHSEEISLS